MQKFREENKSRNISRMSRIKIIRYHAYHYSFYIQNVWCYHIFAQKSNAISLNLNYRLNMISITLQLNINEKSVIWLIKFFNKMVHLGIRKRVQFFTTKKFVTITYLDILHFLHARGKFFNYVTTAKQEYSKAMMIGIFCARNIFSLSDKRK